MCHSRQRSKVYLIKIIILLFLKPALSSADTGKITQINGTMIPKAFSQALQDGMSIPIFIHLDKSINNEDDQKIGNAFIWLDNDILRVQKVELEENDNNATVIDEVRNKIKVLKNQSFEKNLTITINRDARLILNLRKLILQLVVNKNAIGTVLHSRSKDIGKPSVNNISSTLSYNLGIYNNQMKNGGNNNSSYLSLYNVTALRENHLVVDGSLYGIGSGNQNSDVYKAMYERDFAGHRLAAGMLDTWNLQSLGPMTAFSAGKIYGISWGNSSNSTLFDNTQSTSPVIAFLPSAGEVHISREGKLMSVQNFSMGSHEVNTGGLPYGIYDVEVEVIVNGHVVSKRTQRVNKLFSNIHGAGSPLTWQVWGGNFHMDRWSTEGKQTKPAKDSWLAGISLSGSMNTLSWAATAYGYDSNGISEIRLTMPLTNSLSINLQNMLASDNSWSSIGSLSATLPGDFASIWLNQEKTKVGRKIRRNDADNKSIGGSLNLNPLSSLLGTFNFSYTDDLRYDSHYYTVDYLQKLYSGKWGILGFRAGVQQYNNSSSSSNMGKYIALDFSLPLGNWFSAGMTNQNGYTMANFSARKQFDESSIRTVGGNISRAISGDTHGDESVSGSGYAQFSTKYSNGTLNINSGADGYLNTNLTTNGSIGWQGNHIAASGRTDGNAGIIFNTGLENNSKLSAKVNGRTIQLDGKSNFIPLSPYNNYEVELQNSKNSPESYDIVTGRKTNLTLYPGNVALIEPEVKQMVTVSGRIRSENGSLLTNVRINNHIGRTTTDESGEFIMDIDKKYPTIDFNYGGDKRCEVELDLSQAHGAVWVGDVICTGLRSWANLKRTEVENES